MDILEEIFQKCIAAVDTDDILKTISNLKKTAKVVIFGQSEFCGTFGISLGQDVFKDTLNVELASEREAVFFENKIHIIFLSYEKTGLRGYRFPEGHFASSYINKLIQSEVKILSYSAPLSSTFADVARENLPKAYNYVNDYFDKKLSIIILTGLNNDLTFTKMIKSFVEAFDPRNDIEIVVVINGSDDESNLTALHALKSKFDIKFVFPQNNLGYGGGMNAGINVAVGKYIALMPDDIEFSIRNPIAPLVKLLDENEEVGIVGGYFGGYCFSIMDNDVPDGFEFPFWILSVGNPSGPQNCDYIKNRFVEVDFASALFMVFRRELGQYDPNYYPYGMEEIAFSLNAKKKGYKVFLTDMGISHDFNSSVTRRDWVKNIKTKMSNNHLPYSNCSYQFLTSYKKQLRDPVDFFNVQLFSLKEQFKRPPNPVLSLEGMEGKVEIINIKK